jgi:signal peptidase I
MLLVYNNTVMQPQQPKDPRSFDIKPNTHSSDGARPTHPHDSQHHIGRTAMNNAQTHSDDSSLTSNQSTDKERKLRKREEIKNLLFTILFFASAVLVPFLMIVFVFQSYVVDGSSMEPTLQNNNRVFILKLPKTMASLQNKQYVPARNEVIVFKKPSNDNTQLIKRVIGLPGDRVVIENGVVTIYNIDNPQGFNPDAGTDYEGTLEPVDTGGVKVVEDVGQGELFVLGDNRGPGGSLDSHSGLGLVPVENIVGRLWIRYFPLGEFQVFANFLNVALAD